MADAKEESNVAGAVNYVQDKVSDLPASEPAPSATRGPARLFGRERSVHELLGSGTSADILLWRKKHWSAAILVGVTLIYIIFEWIGYTFLSVVSSTFLFLLVILFAWSNVASLMNRPPPPIPSIQVSEEKVYKVVATICSESNQILAILRDVSLGRDFKLFLKVELALYLLSIAGGWFDLLSLVYIGVLGAFTLPVLYDTYQDEIDKHAHRAVHESKQQYRKVNDFVGSKISKVQPKEKKAL